MKNLLNKQTIINAVLFQALWFACVLGGAAQTLWPALIAGAVMIIWQSLPNNRHANDRLLVVAAMILGLIIDTCWTLFGAMQFAHHAPLGGLAPAWIIVMWVGFALTINHSMAWLRKHPLLPALMGFIGGPMAYLAGRKLGAVEYLIDPLILSLLLGIAWAISLTILVKLAQTGQSKHHNSLINA